MDPATLQLALTAALAALDLFRKLAADAKQSGELTPEQEAAFDAQIQSRLAAPHWQPTPKP